MGHFEFCKAMVYAIDEIFYGIHNILYAKGGKL